MGLLLSAIMQFRIMTDRTNYGLGNQVHLCIYKCIVYINVAMAIGAISIFAWKLGILNFLEEILIFASCFALSVEENLAAD